MREVMIKVNSTDNLESLMRLGRILYVSKHINAVGMEIDEGKVNELKQYPNVISYRESRAGEFLAR